MFSLISTVTNVFGLSSAPTTDILDAPSAFKPPEVSSSLLLSYISHLEDQCKPSGTIESSFVMLDEPEQPMAQSISSYSLNIIENYTNSPSPNDTDSLCEDLVENLSGWLMSSVGDLNNAPSPPKVEFWTEWEWILSQAERITIRQAESQNKRIQEELYDLREKGTRLQKRWYFIEEANKALSTWSESDQSLLNSKSLEASLRSKLLRDVVMHFADQWYQEIAREFFHDGPLDSDSESGSTTSKEELASIFAESFYEKPYAKNIVGALVSLSFVASHGRDEQLTPNVLGDILWSWWSTLCGAVREILQVHSLTSSGSELLMKQVIQAAPMVVDLWVNTLKNSEQSINLQGILPKAWQETAKLEEERLQNLKDSNKIDARYSDGPLKMSCESVSLSPDRLKELRNLISTFLESRIPSDPSK